MSKDEYKNLINTYTEEFKIPYLTAKQGRIHFFSEIFPFSQIFPNFWENGKTVVHFLGENFGAHKIPAFSNSDSPFRFGRSII